MLYLTIFLLGGLCGWVIDTAYRSRCANKYTPNTWIPFFSIIYGIAAVLLYLLFFYSPVSFFAHIILGTILCVSLELISGIISTIFLRKRFWDYCSSKFNFFGYIDFQHTFYWFVLVSLFRIFYSLVF